MVDLTPFVAHKRATARTYFLAGTCDIVRTTTTTDAGGTTETRATLANEVPCLYTEDLSPQEIALAERLDVQVTGRLYLPGDQDVIVSDEIENIVLSDGGYLGHMDTDTDTFVIHVYEVASAPRATYEVTRVVLLSGPI